MKWFEERPAAPSLSRFVIVGGAGEVGGLIGQLVRPVARWIEIVDLKADPGQSTRRCAVSRCDVMRWVHGENDLREADCVVLAVPEDVALRALDPLARRMSRGALLVDTLSVKEPIVSRLRRLPASLEKLSINPMFAPTLGLHDQPVLAVEVSPGTRSAQLLGLFKGAGARVVGCDAEEHDRATAAMQALTHAALLSFGAALVDRGEDLGRLLRVAPPPFVALTALLARILAGNPDTYLDIQVSNAHARRARDLLAVGGRRLEGAVGQGQSGFAELLSRLEELLGSDADQLEQRAQRLLEAVRPTPAPGIRINGNGRVTGREFARE